MRVLQVHSDGIDLRDGGIDYAACGGYRGPWVKWATVRGQDAHSAQIATACIQHAHSAAQITTASSA